MRIDVSFRRVGGPPPQKNRFFYFLAVSSNRVYTTSRFDFALMGVMANWRPSSGWMVQTMLRRTGESKEPGGAAFWRVCLSIYLILVYLIRQSGRESSDANATLRLQPFSFIRSYWLFWVREEGLRHIWFRSKEQRIHTHSLSIDFFVGVGVIVNFRKKRKIPK